MAAMHTTILTERLRFRILDGRPENDRFALVAEGDSPGAGQGEAYLSGLTFAELLQLRDALAEAILARGRVPCEQCGAICDESICTDTGGFLCSNCAADPSPVYPPGYVLEGYPTNAAF